MSIHSIKVATYTYNLIRSRRHNMLDVSTTLTSKFTLQRFLTSIHIPWTNFILIVWTVCLFVVFVRTPPFVQTFTQHSVRVSTFTYIVIQSRRVHVCLVGHILQIRSEQSQQTPRCSSGGYRAKTTRYFVVLCKRCTENFYRMLICADIAEEWSGYAVMLLK